MRIRSLTALAAVLLLAGCATPALNQGTEGTSDTAVGGAPAPSNGESPQRGTTAESADQQNDGRSVIRTAAITMVSDDPLSSADAISGVAVAADGYVASVGSGGGVCASPIPELQSDATGTLAPDACRYAPIADAQQVVVVVRIPQKAYEAVLQQIRGAGEVRSVSVNADDVTGSLVDLNSRIRAQRASVARLTQLMNKAENVSDVIAVEQELASRQATVESLLSQRRGLADAVAMSTITVTVVTPDRADTIVPREPRWWDAPWKTFWDSWALMLLAAAAVAPLLIVLAALGAAVVLVVRRGRKQPAAAAEGDPD